MAAKSKALLSKADRLFSLYVRQRDGKCRRCHKSDRTLQCHHLISRTYRKVRFEPDNGVALCFGCHKYLTHRPLDNDDFAVAMIGEQRWAELKVIARDTTYKVDLKDVVADLLLKVEAA